MDEVLAKDASNGRNLLMKYHVMITIKKKYVKMFG